MIMAETNINFAKIVANPSIYSWSQAYNAGKLFAVLSLEKHEEDLEQKDFLNTLGREILNTLEQEFFTLENKDLGSIEAAVKTTSEKIPDDVNCSFVISYLTENILYIFIVGGGKIQINREGKIGDLLHSKENKKGFLKSASGYLQKNDYIFLQTDQFSNIISVDTLSSYLDHKSVEEVAENIAPLIHEKEESGASAVILEYKGEETSILETSLPEEEEEETKEKEVLSKPYFEKSKDFFFTKLSGVKIKKPGNLNHSRKLIATIGIVILAVFVINIFLAVKNQINSKYDTLFAQIYPVAEKKYNDGQSLVTLNQNLARDDFLASQKLLNSGKDKFPKNSAQEKQITSLLDKVNNALNLTSGVTLVSAENVDPSVSSILAAELKFSGSSYFTSDDKNIYFIDSKGIESVDKNGNGKKVIIDASQLPKNSGGLAVYFGNFYVVDKDANQISKFVAASSGFGKTDYLKNSQDLSQSSAIAIDGSIWVLLKNGSILKFTKGSQDALNISGLDNPLSNPIRIATTIDDNNIYVLDSGNSRIVVFDKTGSYKSQYGASVLKTAKDFDVLEANKRIFVLSSGKVYQINLK
jgi:hypothetical protein